MDAQVTNAESGSSNPSRAVLNYSSPGIEREKPAIVRLANSRGIRVTALLLIAVSLTWVWAFRGPDFYIFAIYGFAVLVLISTGRINGLPETRRARVSCVWIARVLLVATLAMTIGTDVCPHARYLCIGPYFFAIRGRACHNSRRARTLMTFVTGRYVTNDW